MKKKLILVFAFFLIVIPISYAVTYKSTGTPKYLAIQGGYGATMYVGISPIASQSQGYIMGMPFSIEDSLVQPAYERPGRQVALISINTNCDFKVEITAPDLSWIKNDDYQQESFVLPYYLTFELQVAYFKLNSIIPEYDTKRFYVGSDGTSQADDETFKGNTSMIIQRSGVSFSFMENDIDYSSFLEAA